MEPDLTEAVIGSAFEIANVLGAGFLEKVYERAYKGQYVGEYMADLVVEKQR